MSKKKIVVFDICGTLYYSNTTFEFIQFYYDKKMKAGKRLRFKILFSRRSPLFWILLICGQILGTDLLKKLVVLSLKNQPRITVDAAAISFFHEKLHQKRICETFLLFDKFEKDQILLLSATIEPVAKAIAAFLGVAYRATELEETAGLYTGKIRKELSGKKLSALEGDDVLRVAWVVSDNYSDLPLFVKSIKSIAVCYSKNDINYWQKHSSADILSLTHRSLPYTYIKTAI